MKKHGTSICYDCYGLSVPQALKSTRKILSRVGGIVFTLELPLTTIFTPSPSEPEQIDRILVHQFDAARPSPGGIDTCIRGILKYASGGQRIAVVGVDTGSGPSWRRIGRWEKYTSSRGVFYFLPVASLDPADQKRRIPHSLRLMLGYLRFRKVIPRASFVQAHRADTAWLVSAFSRAQLTYFIHTQESGLTGKTSDSVWRRAARIHSTIEKNVASKAERIAVFNPEYAKTVAKWNSYARSFPTWYDPELLSHGTSRVDKKVLWVGRVEVPKDPALAVEVYKELISQDPDWSMDIVGSGTLLDEIRALTAGLGDGIKVHGRTSPERVAELMSESDVFLMTSHPGYEGFPRVLVEAMASGCRPVVTEGSDTGSLVSDSRIGYVTNRDPADIASRVIDTRGVERSTVRHVVETFSAPNVVEDIYADKSSWSKK